LRDRIVVGIKDESLSEAAIRLGINSGKGGDPSPQC